MTEEVLKKITCFACAREFTYPAGAHELTCPTCGVRLQPPSADGEALPSWLAGDPLAGVEKPVAPVVDPKPSQPPQPKKNPPRQEPVETPPPPEEDTRARKVARGCGLALLGLLGALVVFVGLIAFLSAEVGETAGGLLLVFCLGVGYAFGCQQFFENAVYGPRGLAEIGGWLEGLLLALAGAGASLLAAFAVVVVVPADSSLGPVLVALVFPLVGLGAVFAGFAAGYRPRWRFSRRVRAALGLPEVDREIGS